MTDTVAYIRRHDETLMMRMEQETADEENQEKSRKQNWIGCSENRRGVSRKNHAG